MVALEQREQWSVELSFFRVGQRSCRTTGEETTQHKVEKNFHAMDSLFTGSFSGRKCPSVVSSAPKA
jgi:hypothetical protein